MVSEDAKQMLMNCIQITELAGTRSWRNRDDSQIGEIRKARESIIDRNKIEFRFIIGTVCTFANVNKNWCSLWGRKMIKVRPLHFQNEVPKAVGVSLPNVVTL